MAANDYGGSDFPYSLDIVPIGISCNMGYGRRVSVSFWNRSRSINDMAEMKEFVKPGEPKKLDYKWLLTWEDETEDGDVVECKLLHNDHMDLFTYVEQEGIETYEACKIEVNE